MKPELFFGLVGAIGTDLQKVSNVLAQLLTEFGYNSTHIRLSALLDEIFPDLPKEPEELRIEKHMDAGDDLRTKTEIGSSLAVMGISRVRAKRITDTGDADKPLDAHAFIFNSLKHPKEVEVLRRIYGDSFLLIGAYSPKQQRLENLARRLAESHNTAKTSDFMATAQRLVQRDEEDVKTDFGQNVRKSFPLSDVFVNVTDTATLTQSLNRFLEMLFAYQFHTPTRDEFGMFHAQAAALRSAALGRQVGAAVATSDGDVLAVGCNEVPKAGGGLYWTGDSPDHRDFQDGYDTNDRVKRNILKEVLSLLYQHQLLNVKGEEGLQELLNAAVSRDDPKSMRQTQILNITEFGRDVHAEMAALLHASRRGISVEGSLLFTTTFPCHNCAKHIVAAGISRVVYIAPYPKSLAAELYPDSIIVDSVSCAGQVGFEPFVGVAPNKYIELFTAGDRKDEAGSIVKWDKRTALPRFVGIPKFYLENEEENLALVSDKLKEKGLLS